MRLGNMKRELPMSSCPWIESASDWNMTWESKLVIPTYTPVRDPRSSSGLKPASTMASWVTSNSIRSCGSMTSACLGFTPKNEASKCVRFLSLPLRSGSPCKPVKITQVMVVTDKKERKKGRRNLFTTSCAPRIFPY